MLEPTDASKSAFAAQNTETLEALRREIDWRKQHDQSRSYLGRAADGVVGLFTNKSEKSSQEIADLYREAQKAQASGNQESLNKIAQEASAKIKADREAVASRDEIDGYATGFVKTATLFMRGRLGLAGTVAAYALDQMNPNDDLKTQSLDGLLGASKGALLKSAFKTLGEADLGIAARGVSFGFTSRALDLGLTRNTYTDPTTGQFSLARGLSKTLDGSLPDRRALVSDMVVLWAAHGLFGGANGFAGGAVERSPLSSTVLTGTTFGLSSGAYHEIARQQEAGEAFDLSKVLKKAAIQGTIDTLAAVPGGMQARAMEAGRLAQLDMARRPAREFMVTDGADALSSFQPGNLDAAALLRVREVLGRAADGKPQLDGEKKLFVQHLEKGDSSLQPAAQQADLIACCNPETLSELARQRHLFPTGEGPVWLQKSATGDRLLLSQG